MAAELPSGTARVPAPARELPRVGAGQPHPVLRPRSGLPARTSLRWSYGAVRGRAPDWPADLDQRSGADLVAYLRQAGFGALLVDRFGYTDGGQALEARLAGAATHRADSPDGRFAWYELG